MRQVEVVLSAVFNGDEKTLWVMNRLRRGPGKKEILSVGEAGEILFPEEPKTEDLQCFLILTACGEETIKIILGELKRKDKEVRIILPEVISVIEEECRLAKEKLKRICLDNLKSRRPRPDLAVV